MTPKAERLFNIIKENCKNGKYMTAPEQCAYFPEKNSYQVFELFKEIIDEGHVIISTNAQGIKEFVVADFIVNSGN